MNDKNYKYIHLRGNLYNVDFSIMTLIYWIFLRKKYTAVKLNFSLRDIIIAKIGYLKIKYRKSNKNNDRIFELPYGYVGIKVRGNGVRVFDFKNDIVYRNQIEERQKDLINCLPFSAKIIGKSGEFYKEEFIDGFTLDKDPKLNNNILKEIYNKFFRNYILENANINNPKSISIFSYITSLKNEIEYFNFNSSFKKNNDYVYSSLIKILDDLSDYNKLEIPLTLSHGDVSPRNIVIANRKITLIDSEHIKYRSLFYDLFDYFYQANQIIDAINIEPTQIGFKKSLEILSELEYDFDQSFIHVFWKLYIINRMLLILNNGSSKKVVYEQFTELMAIDTCPPFISSFMNNPG